MEDGDKSEQHQPAKLDLDTVLVNEVGQFGRYQILALLLATVPAVFSAWATSEYIFTTARIPTRCHIPECEPGAPHEAMFSRSWLSVALPPAEPPTAPPVLQQCARYNNSWSPDTATTPPPSDTCPAAWFDRTVVVSCSARVYLHSDTVVYDFDLGCEEWRRSVIGSARTAGTLLVLPLTGLVSDRWGRRAALALNAFNTSWLGLARSFAGSYETLLALHVLETSLGAGAFSACFILVTELVGPQYRVLAGAALSTSFALGQVLLGLLAWWLPNWRTLTRVLYAPQLLVVGYCWLLAESVRWLLARGRHERAASVLQRAARVNGRELSRKTQAALAAGERDAQRDSSSPPERCMLLLVLGSRPLLLRCVVTPVWWVTNTLVYYGMNVNSTQLSADRYVNFILTAAVEIPGFWTAALLLDRAGRRPVMLLSYWICAACQFGFAFMPAGSPGGRLALFLVGKYCISIVVTGVYVYTGELFPTRYRHRLFSFASTVGRLGSILAPLTPALALTVWESLPAVMFGSLALLSGLLLLIMPETLGTKLPDTVHEAEIIGRKKVAD